MLTIVGLLALVVLLLGSSLGLQPTANSTILDFNLVGYEADEDLPVDAAANAGGGIIYASVFLGFNGATGYVRQYVAADTFAGISKRAADNSGVGSPLGLSTNIGDGTAGGTVVPTGTKGHFTWGGAIGGSAGDVTDVGATVYCSDGQTLTTVNPGSGKVGVIVAFGTSNNAVKKWEIAYQSAGERAA